MYCLDEDSGEAGDVATKRWQSHTGGVVDLRDQIKQDWVLKKCYAGEVWGIGRRLSGQLAAMDIRTAGELAHANAWSLRKQFSVVVEKTDRELATTTCLELDERGLSVQQGGGAPA